MDFQRFGKTHLRLFLICVLGILTPLHMQIAAEELVEEKEKPYKPFMAASYGLDATLWWLDDSFSSNLIDLETIRDTPLFHEIKLQFFDIFGMQFNISLFLDKLLQPSGVFSADFSEGLDKASGGFQTRLRAPIGSLLALIFDEAELDAKDLAEGPYAELAYRYRIFRWDNVIKSKFLDDTVDYFDENASYRSYAVGDTFSTASRMNDFTIGIGINSIEDIPFGVYVGLQVLNLQAPTLIGFSSEDDYVSGDVIMQTSNQFVGLKFIGKTGFDPDDLSTVAEGFDFGADISMSIGGFQAKNDFFQSPESLAFTIGGDLRAGLNIKVEDTLELVIVTGINGTYSLLNIFGSADGYGKILKGFSFHNIGSTFSYTAGSDVYVSISRWETFVIPYLKVFFRF